MGSFGEKTAKKYLEHNGYVICDENFRCPRGEIDIVAKDGEDLVFVEVKTRRSLQFGEPFESVDGIKQKRIMKLAYFYMAQKKIKNINVRFDVVSLWVDDSWNVKEIQLIKNAF